MDDVSKLGPLWVRQLRKEIAARRNRAAESLMTVNPDGAHADQHRMLIEAANTMLAAPELLEALRELDACYCEAGQELSREDRHRHRATLIKARAAVAKAAGSAA